MRALKALVIAMAVLIAAGLGVIVVALVERAGEPLSDSPKAAAGAPAFGEVRVPVPAGARLVETTVAGDRLILRLRLADGAARIVVVDLATGRRLGTVRLVLAPAP